MEGLDAAEPVLARVGLALATFVVLVAGVLVSTDGTAFPTAGPTVSLAPAVSTRCAAAGPYRAPDPGSVGLPPGLGLCPSGPVTVAVAGMVLDGWDVRGGIVVDAPDVVVRRSRVTGDGSMPFGIVTTGAGSVRIEDTTLTGAFPEAAVGGDRWSGERIEITGVPRDGARLGSGARLRNSSLHDFTTPPGAASHAVVLQGGGDMLVEDNRIGLGAGPGSAVLLAPDGGGRRGPVVIRGNEVGGGSYTVAQDAAATEPTDVRITGNRFHRDAGRGPLRVSRRTVLTDNTYLDGGLLPPQ